MILFLLDAMADLKRKREEMEERIACISKELKKLGRQRKRVEKVHIPAGRRAAARALMGIGEGEPTAAFLKNACKESDSDAKAWVEVESSLRAWWASADEDTKEAHTQIAATNKHLHGAIKRARRFIVDEELESWVAEQNVSKGINPVPALTLREASVLKGLHGVGIPKIGSQEMDATLAVS